MFPSKQSLIMSTVIMCICVCLIWIKFSFVFLMLSMLPHTHPTITHPKNEENIHKLGLFLARQPCQSSERAIKTRLSQTLCFATIYSRISRTMVGRCGKQTSSARLNREKGTMKNLVNTCISTTDGIVEGYVTFCLSYGEITYEF